MNLNDIALVSIPNVSSGDDVSLRDSLATTIEKSGVQVLDVHADAVHDRSVYTTAGPTPKLVTAMAELASAAVGAIDLRTQKGVHPRVGALDVCPFVPLQGDDLSLATTAAREAGAAIAERGLPVYLYGAAATRDGSRELPDLRREGLEGLSQRARRDLPPDLGPKDIDPARGVVCVGARGPLIAFNVWLLGSVETARAVARTVRESDGGLPGVRALGLPISRGVTQVSLNLVSPGVTGVDAAFDAVAELVRKNGAVVIATELVGLPPRRFLPDPDAQAARLLVRPGRSLETVLEETLSSEAI